MYGVVRTYSGAGAKELFDLIEQRKEEIEALIRPVSGFVSYGIIRTAEGGITVTICADQSGTDQSSQIARDWIVANAPDLGVAAPTISEGPVSFHMS